MRKFLDKLLVAHFRDVPFDVGLSHLEQDVWREIRAAQAETALPWTEKVLLALNVPRFQMASLAMALALGLVFSPAFPPNDTTKVGTNLPGMEVFTLDAPYLTTNLIERSE